MSTCAGGYFGQPDDRPRGKVLRRRSAPTAGRKYAFRMLCRMGLGMIRTLDKGAIAAAAVAGLGLDEEASGIDSPEALAAAIRRAASFSCPTTQRELSKLVIESLEWLVSDPHALAGEVTSSLEAVINYGDLLELSSIGGRPSKSSDLYLAAPSF